jgi:hypothetical protein
VYEQKYLMAHVSFVKICRSSNPAEVQMSFSFENKRMASKTICPSYDCITSPQFHETASEIP